MQGAEEAIAWTLAPRLAGRGRPTTFKIGELNILNFARHSRLDPLEVVVNQSPIARSGQLAEMTLYSFFMMHIRYQAKDKGDDTNYVQQYELRARAVRKLLLIAAPAVRDTIF